MHHSCNDCPRRKPQPGDRVIESQEIIGHPYRYVFDHVPHWAKFATVDTRGDVHKWAPIVKEYGSEFVLAVEAKRKLQRLLEEQTDARD